MINLWICGEKPKLCPNICQMIYVMNSNERCFLAFVSPSPYLSVNWKAWTKRSVSSTERPTGKSLMVICLRTPLSSITNSPLADRFQGYNNANTYQASSNPSRCPQVPPLVLAVAATSAAGLTCTRFRHRLSARRSLGRSSWWGRPRGGSSFDPDLPLFLAY